jgi:hypothetical protein
MPLGRVHWFGFGALRYHQGAERVSTGSWESLPVRKRNRQYGGHDAEIAAMAPGAEAAAALSHFGTVFGSPPGVPGGGMTGIAPPSRGGAAIFGSTPEGGQMTPFD